MWQKSASQSIKHKICQTQDLPNTRFADLTATLSRRDLRPFETDQKNAGHFSPAIMLWINILQAMHHHNARNVDHIIAQSSRDNRQQTEH